METIADFLARTARERQERDVAAAGIVISTTDKNPDQVAGDLSLANDWARETGKPMPPLPLVEEYRPVFQQQIEAKRNSTILSSSPKLAEWLKNPQNAALARDDLADLSYWERNVLNSQGALTRAVGRGTERIGMIPGAIAGRMNAEVANDIGKTFDQILAEEAARYDGNVPAALMGDVRRKAQTRLDMTEGLTEADRDRLQEAARQQFGAVVETMKRIEAVPMSEAASRFRDETLNSAENTLTGVLSAFASDPSGGISFLLETAAESIPQIGAAGVATIAAGPGAGVATMGAASFLTESTTETVQFLREKGIDLSTPETAFEVLGDQALLQEAVDRGLARGMIVGILDAASGGVAGQQLARSAIGNLFLQSLAQAGLGGAGEAGAQIATDGKLNWADVVIEALAEFATSPIEVAALGGAKLTEMRQNQVRAKEAAALQSKIAEIAQQSAASKLRARMPDVFRAWVERATENGPAENLYVPADKFTEYFQSIGMDPYALADEMDGVSRADLETALETGGDLRIPTATYAAKLAGSDADQFFMENMRFDPDEFTSAEARAFEETKAELMAEAMNEAERIFAEQQELRTYEQEIYDTMVERLRMAGRATDVATSEAALYPAFYKVMAERAGIPLGEFIQRYPLPQVRGDLPQGVQPKNVDDLTRTLATARAARQAGVNQPQTPLLEFISNYGGIIDPGGELKARDAEVIRRGRGRKNLRLARDPDLFVSSASAEAGRSFGADNVAQAAIEAGLMADNPVVQEYRAAILRGDQAPDITRALFDEIDRELRGEATMTDEDMNAGPSQDDMLADLERYLAEIGVTLDDDDATIRAAIDADQAERGRVFFQEQRGSIAFPGSGVGNGETVVSLFRSADLSTFIHESGHYFLTVLQDMAAKGEASAVTEFETVKSWWRSNAAAVAKDAMRVMSDVKVTEANVIRALDAGTTGNVLMDAAIDVGMQEQFARGFEQYLMEGKAPSVELRTAFEKFRAWLLSVYRSLRGLNVEINDELRGVFDRMLATDEEIAQARQTSGDTGPMFSTAPAGMSPEDWGRYQKIGQQAADEASARLLAETMAPIRREAEKQYQAEKQTVRAEVEPQINARKEYRAIEWMGNRRWLGDERPQGLPDMRLDRAVLVERYGEGVLKTLPRGKFPLYANEGGVDPEIAAGLFGFVSADEMIRALERAPKRAEAINAEVERVMFERHGDPLRDGTVEAKAVEAVHGDKRARVLAMELDILRAQPGGTKSAVAVFREMARGTLARMPVRDAMASNRYLAAERKAGEASFRAFSGGDIQAAAEAKRRQLLNYMLYAESRKIEAEVQQAEKLAARLQKKSVRDKLAGDYLEAIDEILNRYDFRRLSARAEDKRGALLAYVERMKAEGRENELAIPERVLQDAQRMPYKRLTVEHLRGVVDSLKNIEHTARLKQKLIDAQSQRDLDAVVDDILGSFDDNVKERPPGRVGTTGERVRSGLRGFLDLVLNAATILREIDGFKDFGPAFANLKAPIDQAMNRLQARREKAATDLDALYEVYTKDERRKMAVREFVPEIGASLSKWERIAVALNMGNEGNYQRLTDTKVRGGFTEAQVKAIVASLDARDARFVQSVWDYLETFRGDIEAREKRVTGVAPKWVEARPVQIAGIDLRGGYYPLRYDPRLSSLARDDATQDIAKALQAGRFGKAQTRNGHLKERATSSGRPVELDIAVLHKHVQQVVYDLELSEPVANSWRILQDGRVRDAFMNSGKQADFDALEIWLKDVAEGELRSSNVAGQMARRFKSNFTAAKLAFNLSTVAVQITGVAQSMVVVGKRDFLSGVQAALRPGVREEVFAKSLFMRERSTTFNKDIFDLYNDPRLGPVATRWQEIRNDWIAPAGFWLMTKVQSYLVDVPTWLAGYQQGLRKFPGDEAKAIAYADDIVKRSQASGLFSDRSAVERGSADMRMRQNEFLRLFTTLGSYMFAKFNVAYERTGRARQVIEREGVSRQSAQEAMSWTIDMTFLFALEAVLYAAIKGRLPDEDDDDEGDGTGDEWAAFLAKETALSFMSTIPFVRDVGSVLTGFGGGGAYGAITEELAKPLIQIGQGEVDKALVKSVISATGLFTGAPSGQINRAVDAGWRQAEGEDVSPAEYLLGRMGN